VEHFVASHALEPTIDVSGDVALGVPDVQPFARRVWEHVQHKTLWFVRVFNCVVDTRVYPVLLPFTLNGFVIKFPVHNSQVK